MSENIELNPNHLKRSKKSKIRLIIFSALWIISYLICTISLFFTSKFLIPILSFIVLFLSIYFIVLDVYRYKIYWWFLLIFIAFLIETIFFIIFSGFSRYLVIELLLFHATIWSLYLMLSLYLEDRNNFSPFSYFTWWGFLVTTLLTIFFCVFMMWKYTQIPFTCDDIESFPTTIVETTTNPFKKAWAKVVWFFTPDEKEDEDLKKPELYVLWNPLSDSSAKAQAEKIEATFENITDPDESILTNIVDEIKSQTLDVTGKISKKTCEYSISILKKTQNSEGFQITAIIIAYFILVWVFKILLWIVSIVWFILYMLLRVCWIYKYEKKLIEKEIIA